MFVGHLALSLAGKRAAPTVSLGWLMAAVTALDLVYITHAPDLPLWPGRSPRFGLGLWNSIPGTLLVEGAMWVAGIALYLRHRDATRLNWSSGPLVAGAYIDSDVGLQSVVAAADRPAVAGVVCFDWLDRCSLGELGRPLLC